ncbi:hypothetical protein, partial [Roseomonas elaeocarpi]
SAVAVLLYCFFILMGGKTPEEIRSLDLLTDLLPGWWWLAVSAAGGIVQLVGLILNIRFLRAASAFGQLLWIGFIVRMVFPIYPWAPLLGLACGWAVPNFFVVARHARDW